MSDRFLKQVKEVKESGHAVDIESGQTLPSSVLSMNAYIG